MYDNRDNIDFAHAHIGRLFASIFFPTLLGMVFNMAFIFTDGIFIGHGIGSHGLAAINFICPLMMIINGMGMMFGVGASVVAAIHMAQNNIKAARLNITQAFLTGVTASTFIGLVCYIFPQPIIHLLGAHGAIYPHALEYYLWFLPTCLLNMITSIGLFVIRLDGSPRFAMTANIIPAIINGILDYIFIYPLQWGLMGASLATDIGGLVGSLMVIYYMAFRARTLQLHRIKLTLTSLRLSLRNIGYMVRVGVSGFVGEAAVAVMVYTGNLLYLHYLGSHGVAAFSVACYLFPLVYMVYSAVAQSAQPIISFNHGNHQSARVRSTLRFSLGVALLLGVAVALSFVFFAPGIVSCFLDSDVPSFDLAARGLPLYAAGFPFLAINICLVGYLQSIERAIAAVIFTLLRGLLFLVSCFIVLPQLIGVPGLWLAIPLAEALTTFCLVIYFRRIHQK